MRTNVTLASLKVEEEEPPIKLEKCEKITDGVSCIEEKAIVDRIGNLRDKITQLKDHLGEENRKIRSLCKEYENLMVKIKQN